jgi:hypothetical protein
MVLGSWGVASFDGLKPSAMPSPTRRRSGSLSLSTLYDIVVLTTHSLDLYAHMWFLFDL